MKGNLQKAYEITDAKIQFVSLVGKAANKRTFIMTKQEGDTATFQTFGKIVKADAESHFITGIVYEPMTEDTDGNFMTEAEITKACHWFAKNGNQVDLQHSFEPLPDASVVENWIAKSDCEIDGTEIKKGTWLMTVEVTDSDIWDAVEKGDITGFSMGGIGAFSEEDTDLNVEKSKDKKGLFKQLAGAFGFDVVEKGKVADLYTSRIKSKQFWTAHDALEEVLSHWDYVSQTTVYETDEEVIREALEDYSAIISDILSQSEPIAKSLFLAKKKSDSTDDGSDTDPEGEDQDDAQGEDEDKDNIKKEVTDMTKQDLETIVTAAVQKAMDAQANEPAPEPTPAPAAEPTPAAPVEKGEEKKEDAGITAETIEKMVQAAVDKAVNPPQETKEPDASWIEEMVQKAVDEAVEPILKARGLPTHLEGDGKVEKEDSEPHYLHGIL